MNKLTSYEQLIADKVQEVAIPDMANSIWATIEQALDGGGAGSGSEEQTPEPGNPGGRAYPGKARYFYIAGCIIVGVIVLLIITRQRQHKRGPARPAGTEERQPAQQDSFKKTYVDSNSSNNENKVIPGNPAIKKNDSVKTVLLPVAPFYTDSIFGFPLLIHNRDSMSLPNQGLTIQRRPDSLNIPQPPLIPIKKPRGVMGISDSDYKLKVEKKDSIRS